MGGYPKSDSNILAPQLQAIAQCIGQEAQRRFRGNVFGH
jgi:hypothetical protein